MECIRQSITDCKNFKNLNLKKIYQDSSSQILRERKILLTLSLSSLFQRFHAVQDRGELVAGPVGPGEAVPLQERDLWRVQGHLQEPAQPGEALP